MTGTDPTGGLDRPAAELGESARPPLVIACDWIPPAFGAVGRYEWIRAERLSARGRTVVLIGFSENGIGKNTVRAAEEEHLNGGLMIVRRLIVPPPNKANLIKRALWTLSVNLHLLLAASRETRRLRRKAGSVEIKVTGSPPFFAYLYLALNRLTCRDRIIYRMSDFYPETAIMAGRVRWIKPLVPVFHRLRRMADQIDVLGEDQRERLRRSGLPMDKIRLERDGSPVVFTPGIAPASRPTKEGEVALLYSGNLGVAHDPSTFLEAYRRHVFHGANRVRLWMNGQGVRLPEVDRYCRRHGLPLYRTPLVDIESLPSLMLAPDAHLVLLGDAFWGYVLPSKIYAAIESGRPVLYLGPAESDVDMLCAPDPRNLRVRNGDSDGVFAALEALAGVRSKMS